MVAVLPSVHRAARLAVESLAPRLLGQLICWVGGTVVCVPSATVQYSFSMGSTTEWCVALWVQCGLIATLNLLFEMRESRRQYTLFGFQEVNTSMEIHTKRQVELRCMCMCMFAERCSIVITATHACHAPHLRAAKSTQPKLSLLPITVALARPITQ